MSIVSVISAILLWLLLIVLGLVFISGTVFWTYYYIAGFKIMRRGFASIAVVPKRIFTQRPLLDADSHADDLYKLVFFRGLGELYFDILMGLVGFVITIVNYSVTGQRTLPAWLTIGLFFVVAARGKVAGAMLAIDIGLSDSESVVQTMWNMLHDDFFKWVRMPSLAFLSSCLDVIDGFAHGIALGSAACLSELEQAQFAHGWSSGVVAGFGKVIVSLHMAGLMTLVMLMAAVWQLGSVAALVDLHKGESYKESVYYLSRIAGFGGVARLMEVRAEVGDYEVINAGMLVAVSKAMGETCPWIFLQTSLLMTSFSSTDAIIVTVSLMMSVKQVASMQAEQRRCPSEYTTLPLALFVFLLILNAARVAGAVACQGAFGIFTGCV